MCANAGVDRSNAGAPDTVVLLPVDPDASAARIRGEIADRMGATVAVVITDTFGRAWREGHTNVAIGIAGLPALKRYIGQRDPEGYELRVTEIAVADEIAGAAELVMGKLDRCPVAIVRGLSGSYVLQASSPAAPPPPPRGAPAPPPRGAARSRQA